MSLERLKWAVPAGSLAALGLSSSAELFAPSAALSSRVEVLADTPARLWLRFPLPGTSDARGNLTGRPGALGTGWLWLSVFRPAGWRAPLTARFTPPRSASLAEREWNLLCHLRARGIGTPEPLLVGARGNGPCARHSFLLVRALEDAFPLPRYLRTDGVGPERERALRALALTLQLLARSGTELPELSAEHLWLTPSGSGECETETTGLRKNKLPGVALSSVAGGRFVARSPARALARIAARLGPTLAPCLEPRELDGFFAHLHGAAWSPQALVPEQVQGEEDRRGAAGHGLASAQSPPARLPLPYMAT